MTRPFICFCSQRPGHPEGHPQNPIILLMISSCIFPKPSTSPQLHCCLLRPSYQHFSPNWPPKAFSGPFWAILYSSPDRYSKKYKSFWCVPLLLTLNICTTSAALVLCCPPALAPSTFSSVLLLCPPPHHSPSLAIWLLKQCPHWEGFIHSPRFHLVIKLFPCFRPQLKCHLSRSGKFHC